MIRNKQEDQDKIIIESLEKIVVNVGVGRLSQQPNFEDKILSQINNDLALMTGQKPKACRARKSIAGFKIREGATVGLKITLRGSKMVDFFKRLIRIVLPRVRDFSGLDIKSIDKKGTLNVGLGEQFVFPEIDLEKSPLLFPLGINIVPAVKVRDEAIKIYQNLGIPFKKEETKK